MKRNGITKNFFKVYAEFWDRRNKSMQGKLEARTDYDTTI